MILFKLKLMCNALSADKTKYDFKEIKKEIRTISEKLKSQMTCGDQGKELNMFSAI